MVWEATVVKYGVYHFAEMTLVNSHGTTIVPVMSLPKNTVVEQVLVRVHTLAVRAGGATTLTIGDNNSANGFITASDAKAAVGTVFGEDPSVRGAYLYDATKKGSFIKHYAADKTLRLVLDTVPDSEGEYEVTVIGHRIGSPQ